MSPEARELLEIIAAGPMVDGKISKRYVTAFDDLMRVDEDVWEELVCDAHIYFARIMLDRDTPSDGLTLDPPKVE